jgi:hypothetical protein
MWVLGRIENLLGIPFVVSRSLRHVSSTCRMSDQPQERCQYIKGVHEQGLSPGSRPPSTVRTAERTKFTHGGIRCVENSRLSLDRIVLDITADGSSLANGKIKSEWKSDSVNSFSLNITILANCVSHHIFAGRTGTRVTEGGDMVKAWRETAHSLLRLDQDNTSSKCGKAPRNKLL